MGNHLIKKYDHRLTILYKDYSKRQLTLLEFLIVWTTCTSWRKR